MRLQKTILLLVAVMVCFSVPVSAQTTDINEASKEAKPIEDGSSSGTVVSGYSISREPATTPASPTSGKTVNVAAPEPQTPAGSSDKWHFQIAPYIFLAGLSGEIGVNNLSTDVDASAGDILDALDFGFMGAFEARKNKFSIMADIIYANLENSTATSGPLFSEVAVDATLFMFSPQVGYRLVERQAGSLDAVVGIRFWHTRTRIEFTPGLLAGRAEESSKNWADVIAGLRGQVHLSKRFFLLGRGDLGGGGCDFTYQLFGGAGIDVAKSTSLVIGYRHLFINYDRDGFLFDGAMSGLLLGAAFRF